MCYYIIREKKGTWYVGTQQLRMLYIFLRCKRALTLASNVSSSPTVRTVESLRSLLSFTESEVLNWGVCFFYWRKILTWYDEMQRKLKRSADENWEEIKTSDSGFSVSKPEMEGEREGGWSRGATPLSRRGIPLLQWSAVLPLHLSPPSKSSAPLLPPSSFPHTHRFLF